MGKETSEESAGLREGVESHVTLSSARPPLRVCRVGLVSFDVRTFEMEILNSPGANGAISGVTD